MPFGMGPRNCIAIRFAKEELKLVLCTLIEQFRFFPVAETEVGCYNFLGIPIWKHLEQAVMPSPIFSYFRTKSRLQTDTTLSQIS